jgi:hypothetical protein
MNFGQIIITLIVAVLGSSVISSLISVWLPEFLKNYQREKMIYGAMRFHLARLSSVLKKKNSIIQEINDDGILDLASLKNQSEAMRKIYKIIGNNLHFLKKKHRQSAQKFIDAYIDQSSNRAKKLVNAIESLHKDLCN